MTTMVYSNVSDPGQGGGLLYILAIAAALAESDRVRVLFPSTLAPDEVQRLFPIPLNGLSLEAAPLQASLLREIGEVAAGLFHARVLVQATEVPRLRGLRHAYLKIGRASCRERV